MSTEVVLTLWVKDDSKSLQVIDALSNFLHDSNLYPLIDDEDGEGWSFWSEVKSDKSEGGFVSTKPKCPNCGAGVTLLYRGAVIIDTETGVVTNGGVIGGSPVQWDCFSCDEVERTDLLEELGADLVHWLFTRYPNAEEELEAGREWELKG